MPDAPIHLSSSLPSQASTQAGPPRVTISSLTAPSPATVTAEASKRPKPSLLSHLCARCQSFDIHAFARDPHRRRGYLLRDVADSAEQGCEFCTLLQDCVVDVPEPTYSYNNFKGGMSPLDLDMYVHMTLSENYADSKNLQRMTSGEGLRANRMKVEVGGRFGNVHRNASGWEICLAADSGSKAAQEGVVSGRYLGRDLASEEHYRSIQAWLAGCNKHSKCNETVSGASLAAEEDVAGNEAIVGDEEFAGPQEPLLPSRCIYIMKHGKGVRLRETGGKRAQYITLTHRWNQETEHCKTTMQNYNARLEGKQLYESLPKLFKDVLVIAEKLRIHYVWIDSICIVQSGDNGNDWNREAPRMAHYYQKSLFTIAGTMEDVSNGLVHALSPDSVPFGSKLVRLPYRNCEGEVAGYFYVFKRKVPVMDDYNALVRGSILFKRGWILQEWLLSKRLLWYTPKGLMFECHSQPPRTDLQEEILPALARPDLQAHLQLKMSFHHSHRDLLGFWYHALEVYSTCHLTKPEKDRILAVAGLAIEVARVLDKRGEIELTNAAEKYVSGLWLHDICHGLLWEQDHYAAGPAKETIEEAPSWSWASVITPVKWPKRDDKGKVVCKVLGVYLKERQGTQQEASRNRGSQNSHSHDSAFQNDASRWRYFVAEAQLSLHRNRDTTSNRAFEPKTMASRLHIRGPVYIVHLRGYLTTQDNLRTAAVATAYENIPQLCRWRALCNPKNPETIAGWASVERLEDDSVCSDSGVAVLALHVSTRYLRSGPLLKRTDSVLDILLLEEVSSGFLRRLGIGRIFDSILIKEFENADERSILFI